MDHFTNTDNDLTEYKAQWHITGDYNSSAVQIIAQITFEIVQQNWFFDEYMEWIMYNQSLWSLEDKHVHNVNVNVALPMATRRSNNHGNTP